MYNIRELENQVQKFCEDRNWDQYHSPKDLAIGLSTESNELLDIFRFKTELDMQKILLSTQKREEISDEIGDIFFFLLRFAQKYQFDLDQCLTNKLIKNAEKYPVERVKGKNLKYNEY